MLRHQRMIWRGEHWLTYLLHWFAQSGGPFLLRVKIRGPESHFSTVISSLRLGLIRGVDTREKQLEIVQ